MVKDSYYNKTYKPTMTNSSPSPGCHKGHTRIHGWLHTVLLMCTIRSFWVLRNVSQKLQSYQFSVWSSWRNLYTTSSKGQFLRQNIFMALKIFHNYLSASLNSTLWRIFCYKFHKNVVWHSHESCFELCILCINNLYHKHCNFILFFSQSFCLHYLKLLVFF